MPSFSAAGNQALNQLSNLPFDNIIGGPLNAAILAQAQAAETTVDFIKSVGLQEVNGQTEAINVQFVYEDSSGQARRITVPILAIVPIPFIIIDNLSISFKAKITASAAAQSSRSRSSSGYVSGSSGYYGKRFRASLNAGYSAKKDSKASQESKYAVEYTMDVQVNASQAGLPAGMEAVLGFLQQGTHELPVAMQAKVIGLLENLQLQAGGTFGTAAPKFSLVINNANSQPVSGLATTDITVASNNDYLSGTVAEAADADDGIYKVTLAPGGSLPSIDAGDVLDDEVTIEIVGPTDVLTLTRPVSLIVV